MKQKQVIAYQLELFDINGEGVVYPFSKREAVSGAYELKDLQVIVAGEQERALVCNLMEIVLSPKNIWTAYKQVKQNKGAGGTDGMQVEEFAEWFKHNGSRLIEELRNGKYQPQPVRLVEIPKPNGGKRKLGIPTVIDRVIQQAISQELVPIYEAEFSDSSYGFRPKRSAHQALQKASEYVSDGRTVVVDIDLKNFFDVVNHDRLMYRLSTRIGDKSLLRLIRKYLQSGIMTDGVVSQRTEGTPQGSPLSPLLSNIVLDELDRELERRGHCFVRYADDCNIFVHSQKAGERVMQTLCGFIENKLKLKINTEKSKVCFVSESKFLGYTILTNGMLTVSKQSILRIKSKIKQITRRNRGVKFEQVIAELNHALRGWLNYFRWAKCHKFVQNLDAWIRRKLRCYRIKRCKCVHTLQQFLHRRGVETWQSWILALSGKGFWRKSGCPQCHQAMGQAWFQELGLYSLTFNYETLNNLQKPPCTKVRTVV
jgi:group II intron reverse transcriptase/maturase